MVLPGYNGSYSVGWVDLESKQQTATKVGSLVRVFYPSTEHKKAAKGSSWLPHSKWLYAKGYGDFLKAPTAFSACLIYPFMALGRTHSTHALDLASLNHSAATSADADASTATINAALDKFPVVIFSHGLGGMRTTYSQICGNLASRGFIVASVEHADGSAAFTSRAKTTIQIPHYHPVPADLLPGEEVPEGLLRVRTKQVNTRRDEVVDAIQLLKELNEGNLDSLFEVPKLERDLAVLGQFQGKLDFDSMVMMGHSFGGATTINTIHSTDIDFKCAVVLDPWMFSVQHACTVTVPMLNFQSEVFHWKDNLDQMKKMIDNHAYSKASVFGLIKNTKHQDASDLGLFFPWLMRKAKQSGPQAPSLTHEIQDQVVFDFISQYVSVVPPPTKGSSSEKKTMDTSSFTLYGEEAWAVFYEQQRVKDAAKQDAASKDDAKDK